MIGPEKVARRLGVTLAVFNEKLPELLRNGFPRCEPILGVYSLEAVDRWIDQQYGLTAGPPKIDIQERLRSIDWRSPRKRAQSARVDEEPPPEGSA